MAATINTPHVQVKFFTKQSQYAVPESPFSVPSSVGVVELSNLINGILQQDEEEGLSVEFDFLVSGEFLRVSLDKHMEQNDISTETVVELEYIEKQPAPKPEDSLLHDDWVSCLQAAGDYILSGCYDNTVKLWTKDGQNLTTIPGHSGALKSVAWIKQDDEPIKRFLSGSHDQTILMWEWNRENNAVDCVHTCRGHAGSVDCLAVDASATKFCSGSWDKMLKVWSAVPNPDEVAPEDEAGENPVKKKKTDGAKVPKRVPLMTLSGHKEGISATAWLDEKQVCTASWDHTIKLWDLEQAAEVSTLTASKVFLDVSYSPLNRLLVSGSSDRHVRLWDPRVTDGAVVKSTFTSHNGWVTGVAWSPNNENLFISGSYDNILKLWDTRSPKAPLYNMAGHKDKILAVDWSIPQMMLSGSSDNTLKIFLHSSSQESSD